MGRSNHSSSDDRLCTQQRNGETTPRLVLPRILDEKSMTDTHQIAHKPSAPASRSVGLEEPLLPSGTLVRYLYAPGELEGGRRRATDPVWSLTVHTVRNVVQRGGQPALYYLNSASVTPARGFVREELLIVPHGTELPPDQILIRSTQ